jgi:hypothetical protein
MPAHQIVIAKQGNTTMVVPGAHGNRPSFGAGDTVTWHNNTNSDVDLILPRDAHQVFVNLPTLVIHIPPHSTYTDTIRAAAPAGGAIYKVYVITDDDYGQGGSDPEYEVK